MNNNVVFSDLPLDPDLSPDTLSINARAVLSGFKLLMATFPGTCLIGMHDFGCNLNRYTFDPPDRTLAILIANEIEMAVKHHCPDIVLPRSHIQVEIRPEGDGYDIGCRLAIPALGMSAPVNFKLGVTA